MRRKIVRFVIAGILVLVFGLASTPARAKFIMDVSYYSLGFGKINDYFAETAGWRDTNPKFKSGMMYGLALEYEVNPHFQLRLEHSLFEAQTSGSLWMDLGPSYFLAVYKLTITPVILSGIYEFSPFYIGAGVGSFPIIFMYTHTKYIYTSQGLVDTSSVIGSANDGATGLVLMAGFKFGDKPISLNLEARYVVDTKAKLELDWVNTGVDLSGLQLGLLLGFKF